jgi:nucleoside-diphosphate-sugar epimerase
MVHDALKNKKIIITNKNISRPILAIKDLASAVIEIINGSLSFGIYNLASFNSTVEEIANVVNAMTGVVIEDLGQQGEPYDFRISSKKFMDTYNFQFKNSIGNIVGDLIESYTKQFPVLVKRNSYYDYKG